jgi:hypothetical protein
MPRIMVEVGDPVQLVPFGTLLIGETFRYSNQDYLKITRHDAFNFGEYTCRSFVSTTEVLPTTAHLVVDE